MPVTASSWSIAVPMSQPVLSTITPAGREMSLVLLRHLDPKTNLETPCTLVSQVRGPYRDRAKRFFRIAAVILFIVILLICYATSVVGLINAIPLWIIVLFCSLGVAIGCRMSLPKDPVPVHIRLDVIDGMCVFILSALGYDEVVRLCDIPIPPTLEICCASVVSTSSVPWPPAVRHLGRMESLWLSLHHGGSHHYFLLSISKDDVLIHQYATELSILSGMDVVLHPRLIKPVDVLDDA